MERVALLIAWASAVYRASLPFTYDASLGDWLATASKHHGSNLVPHTSPGNAIACYSW